MILPGYLFSPKTYSLPKNFRFRKTHHPITFQNNDKFNTIEQNISKIGFYPASEIIMKTRFFPIKKKKKIITNPFLIFISHKCIKNDKIFKSSKNSDPMI